MSRYTVMPVERKLEIINQLLAEIRNYVDSETGIRTFPISRFAIDMGLMWRETDWALKHLKRLGLIKNLGSAGKAGGIWRVDISDRMVTAEDLQGHSGSSSIPQDILERRLRTEHAKVESLERDLANRDARISDLEAELANLRETIEDELLSSLVIFLEERKGSQ